jgi:hypothetical protein
MCDRPNTVGDCCSSSCCMAAASVPAAAGPCCCQCRCWRWGCSSAGGCMPCCCCCCGGVGAPGCNAVPRGDTIPGSACRLGGPAASPGRTPNCCCCFGRCCFHRCCCCCWVVCCGDGCLGLELWCLLNGPLHTYQWRSQREGEGDWGAWRCAWGGWMGGWVASSSCCDIQPSYVQTRNRKQP